MKLEEIRDAILLNPSKGMYVRISEDEAISFDDYVRGIVRDEIHKAFVPVNEQVGIDKDIVEVIRKYFFDEML